MPFPYTGIFGRQKRTASEIDQDKANATEINLSNDKDFNQLYVDYMFF